MEEFRTIFLGHEIMNIYSNITQYEDIDSNSESSNKRHSKMKQLYESNSLIKSLKQYYDDLRSWSSAQKILINNIIEFKFPLRVKYFENPYLEKFHSLIIYKKNNIQHFLQGQQDQNQIFFFLLENTNSLKPLYDIALEYNLDLSYLNFLANQIEYWGFGKVIKKINNFSILCTNPDFNFKFTLSKAEKKFEEKFGISIYFATQNFATKMSLIDQYKKYFNFLPPNKFLNMVNFLLEHQCIIQCNVYFALRWKFKDMLKEQIVKLTRNGNLKTSNLSNVDDDPEIMLMNKSQIAFKKNEKYNHILSEYDNYNNLLNKFKGSEGAVFNLANKKISKFDKPQTKYEKQFSIITSKFSDFINQLGNLEVDILNNIRYFLTGEFTIDEIIYYSGYKEEVLHAFLKKHSYLFNKIIIQDQD